MNYTRDLTQANVTVSDYSPRNPGETESRSQWKEIKELPYGYKERVSLATKLSQENKEVWLKTATGQGRARLFVRLS